MKIIRIFFALSLWTLLCATAAAQAFDKWATENGKAEVRWHTRLLPAALSPHQRQMVTVDVIADGPEISPAPGTAVSTPLEFRRAVAAIMDETGKL